MGAEQTNFSSLPLSGKLTAIAIGVGIILVTTTVPYLTLLNDFFFFGIFLAGMVAVYYAVISFQVRLSYNEAFLLGSFGGIAGGMFSEAIGYLLMELAGYRPGTESLKLLVDWARSMAAGKPELAAQMRELTEMEAFVLAPVELTLADLFTGMLQSSIFYGAIAGLGGMFTVLRLKRQAAKRE